MCVCIIVYTHNNIVCISNSLFFYWRGRFDFICLLQLILLFGASYLVHTVKRLPAMWETHVQSLGQEDSLEKEMATHSSPLAWKISWMEEPGRLQSMGSQRVVQDWLTSLSFFPSFSFINIYLGYCSLLSIMYKASV